MQKDLYSIKENQGSSVRSLFRLVSWLIAVSSAAISFAQSPVMLSKSGTAPIFELPLTDSIVQRLNPTATVRLATRTEHEAQGITYPIWLADSSIAMRNRPSQRLSIVVTAARGNPELSTELLLVISNAGQRSQHPLHLIFDTISSYDGDPLPLTQPPTQPTSNINNQLTPIITFDSQPTEPTPKVAATPLPVPSPVAVESTPPPPSSLLSPSNNTPKQATKLSNNPRHPPVAAAASSTTVTSPPATEINQPPVAPLSEVPTNVASTTPTNTAVPPLPSVKPVATNGSANWNESLMDAWPLILGALLLLLGLLYGLKRQMKNQKAGKGQQNESTIKTQPSSRGIQEWLRNQAANP